MYVYIHTIRGGRGEALTGAMVRTTSAELWKDTTLFVVGTPLLMLD